MGTKDPVRSDPHFWDRFIACVVERGVKPQHARWYVLRAEQAYEQWVCRFIWYCEQRDPRELGGPEVVRFLEYLAVDRNVAASTQNQALNALVFLYHQVLDQPFGDLGNTSTSAIYPREKREVSVS